MCGRGTCCSVRGLLYVRALDDALTSVEREQDPSDEQTARCHETTREPRSITQRAYYITNDSGTTATSAPTRPRPNPYLR